MPRSLTRPVAVAAACTAVLVGSGPAFATTHVTPRPTAPKKVTCPSIPAGPARTTHLAVETLQARLKVARTGTLWPVADAATWTALRAALTKAGVTTAASAPAGPSASPSASPTPSTSASPVPSPAAAPAPAPSGSASPAPASASASPSAAAPTSPAVAPSGPTVDAATWAALGLGGAACPVEPTPGPHGPRTGVPDIDPGLIARTVKAMSPIAPATWPVIPATPVPAPTTNLLGRAAARAALAELGVPYKWGGTGIGGWDCSGLVQHAYATVGINLPRVTSTQIRAGARIPLSQARVGDLVFWATDPTDAWAVYHVGLYLGTGLVVEAPYTGAKVRITPLRANALVGQVIRPTAALQWPVAPGTTSPTVSVLQRLLKITVTGTADAATVAAVQAAQQQAALPVTGTADEVLAAWLAMGHRAGDGPHAAAELVLARLKPKMARVPGTGPATAKLPKPAPKPSASAKPTVSPSPAASASPSSAPSPSSPQPSASSSPQPSAGPSPSART